jgi:hypothetical protein
MSGKRRSQKTGPLSCIICNLFTDLAVFIFYPEEKLESLGRKSENIVKNYGFLAKKFSRSGGSR